MHEIFTKDTYQHPIRPVIPSGEKTREFTFRALLQGLILGVVFTIGNVYLGLKIGATTSASIAAAAVLVGFNRLFFRNTSILENNLAQTIASVGEGIAAGIVFTVPALFLIGVIPTFIEVLLLSSLGGLLGIFIMVLFRRPIVVDECGKLPFPEGFACAEILKTSKEDKPRGRFMLFGFVVGGFYKLCTNAFFLWSEIPSWTFGMAKYFHFSLNCSPAILAMGFIVGTRTAFLLFVGGGLSWWVLNPLIHFFSQGDVIIPPGNVPITAMTSEDIWFNYNRYIGAGAIAAAACFSLWTPLKKFKHVVLNVREEILQSRLHRRSIMRTDKDISLSLVVFSFFLISAALWLIPSFSLNISTVVLLVLLGLVFSVLSSYTAGIVGTSSNPTSGFVIVLVLLSLVVVKNTGIDPENYAKAILTLAVAICTAISMAQTTTQDLYTGYIVGATPRLQQIGEVIGVILPAIIASGCIFLFDKISPFGTAGTPVPQATMIALITKGITDGGVPIILIIIGGVISLLSYLILRAPKKLGSNKKNSADFSVMALAIGLYLPLFLSSPFIVGGLISGVVQHFSKARETIIRGDILCSGLFAGDACIGVILLAVSSMGWLTPSTTDILPNIISIVSFLILSYFVIWFSLYPPRKLLAKWK